MTLVVMISVLLPSIIVLSKILKGVWQPVVGLVLGSVMIYAVWVFVAENWR
jgi:hypothetical protein